MTELTSVSLLERLKDNGDQGAWDSFYDFYTPLVLGFCLQKGASHQLACEVLQESMVYLLRTMPDFTYCPKTGKFRSFLFKLVQSRLYDALRRYRRATELFSDADPYVELDKIACVPGPDTESEWQHQWRLSLMHQGLERIQLKVNEQPYRSFQLYALEGRTATETADDLGISENLVYQHRNRVLTLLTKEVEFLKRNWDGEL
jgi:RNA polymerase sigma-70 factor (ECF subfamily)